MTRYRYPVASAHIIYPQQWAALRAFTFYRLILAGLLSVLFFSKSSPLLGLLNPALFQWTILGYLVFALGSGMMARWRAPDFQWQVHVQVWVDILTITLLMHTSGGPASGLGTLLIVVLAAGSLLLPGQMAFLFAAVATIAIFSEQAYSQLNSFPDQLSYTSAGFLGATFFATTGVAHALARRAQASEKLATQRGIDLANLAQLNEHIIQHLQSGVLVVDYHYTIRLMNSSAWHMLGKPIAYEHQPLALVCPELAAILNQWVAQPGTQSFISPTLRAPGSSAEILPRFEQVSDSGLLIFLEDLSLFKQRMQQMKLAALGRLTASIAHEVRNPLGAISHAGQLLAESSQLIETDRRLVSIIQTQSARINKIIETILQLSRQSHSHPQSFELNAWLHATIEEYCQNMQLDPAWIEFNPLVPQIYISVDPAHLHSIVTNLLQNALQHGNSSHIPKVTVQTEMPPHQFPIMDVIDYGQQIPEEIVEQIFEPFFTTSSQGTGLGLYITQTLCAMNQAQLDYLPAPTGGSCFRVSFATNIPTHSV